MTGLLILLLAAAAVAWPVASPDFWWHLASGREIAASGLVPRAEAFSHTLAGAPWTDFEWLFQLLLYRVWSLGGFHAVIWAKAAALGAAAWTVHKTAREEGAEPWAAALAAACALALARTRAFERPEAASLVLVAVFARLLLRARRTGSAGTLWLLAPLTALWANLHGGFALGLAVLALAGLGTALERGAKAALPHALCLAACAAAALLNPYGARIYEVIAYHWETVGETARLNLIEEWRPLRLGEYPLYWTALLAALGLLARDLLRREEGARFWAPLVLGLALFTSSQVRYPAYLLLVLSPYLFARLRPPGRALPAAAVLLWGWLLVPALRRDHSRSVRWERYPAGAADFLERSGLTGRMFNECAFGGYLEWRFGRSRPVFWDSRYLFFPLQREAALASGDPEAFERFLSARGVDYALLWREGWGELFPRARWDLLYQDDAALVLTRRRPSS